MKIATLLLFAVMAVAQTVTYTPTEFETQHMGSLLSMLRDADENLAAAKAGPLDALKAATAARQQASDSVNGFVQVVIKDHPEWEKPVCKITNYQAAFTKRN